MPRCQTTALTLAVLAATAMAVAACDERTPGAPPATPAAGVANVEAIATDAARAVCPPKCENMPLDLVEGYLTPSAMEQIRTTGWKLLEPFTRQQKGIFDPRIWSHANQVLGKNRDAADPHVEADVRQWRIKLDLITDVATPSQPPRPIRYEATFFNDKIAAFVEGLPATAEMESSLQRDVVLPRSSMMIKSFWYPVRGTERIYPRVWDWLIAQGIKGTTLGDELPTQCVMNPPVAATCVAPEDSFYTIPIKTQSDADLFDCGNKCGSHTLLVGDVMILAGLHVVSKQTPEWLWATFWWRGPDDPSKTRLGTYWTCQDAQRTDAVTNGGVWKNYSMDVTASFKYRKPPPRRGRPEDAKCGVPPQIGKNEGYAATYNPYIEASMVNGLKSSCVHCHARASTKAPKESDGFIPGPGRTAAESLDFFEGHFRLDYMWSLQRALPPTAWPYSQSR